ncbi:zf-HC2 domain-containing protein [Actinosynnema sp. NPDC047251]|uniref:Integral membrane protein n=1 Tax=Saccharothrix espanaensis (strain ATCC 51144 / DSM 44229 / JCM 9112 / NBRC 15066 / NRRL 15764) TaxID=1179773 RepID=K0K6M3_SACES|nr:zf-HC2 domain-containing protein [Saccharothrix espanaensis]CCH33157.1 Integral membrane protein [Saccharothrix espanaensis DSM 44229]
MDCDTCREALSARLDGEPEPAPAGDTDAHLEGCAACRAWQDGAAALTRSLRLRPATATPDLVDAVLAAAPPVPATRGWYPRAALAGVAVAQITLGLGQVLGSGPAGGPAVGGSTVGGSAGHGIHGATGGHLFNESTAWNLALGLGLLWTALRPRATTGLLPVVAGFVVVLGAFSVQDLVSGEATVQRVTSHAILVLGLVLLVVVHRGRRDPDGGRVAEPLPDTPDLGAGVADPPGSTPRARPRPRLRPVSRRRAA